MILKLLNNIRQRQFNGMRKQTEKLDDQSRKHLQEFLQDVPEEVEELHLLQQDMDKVRQNLEASKEKEAFVGKRLQAYRTQLAHFQESKAEEDTVSSTASGAASTSTAAYEKHMQALSQIEVSHKSLQRAIEVMEEKMEILEARQTELQHKIEECQVVYETTTALEVMGLQPSTTELFESVTIPEEGSQKAKEFQVGNSGSLGLDPDEMVHMMEVPKDELEMITHRAGDTHKTQQGEHTELPSIEEDLPNKMVSDIMENVPKDEVEMLHEKQATLAKKTAAGDEHGASEDIEATKAVIEAAESSTQ